MPRVDWRALRGAIVLVVLTLGVGAAAAGGALRFHDQALRGYERQKGRLEALRSRYRTIDEQRQRIEDWLPAFRALQASGVVGAEPRLAWIEALRSAAAHMRLPSLRYRIEPRTPYETGLELDTGAFRSYSTVVYIDVGLLHEGDLERLFREIDARGTGLYRIEGCDLRRGGPSFVMRPDAINLAAECDIRWITLARAEARS